MKILYISYQDYIGKRFNGLSLCEYYNKRGNSASLCVWKKKTNTNHVWQIGGILSKGYGVYLRNSINSLFKLTEKLLSIQSLLYPWPLLIMLDKRFYSADVVHFHIIHSNYFSLIFLPIISRIKPSVMTVHDPWMMTGHCVYPFDCKKWESKCGQCKYLKINMPLLFDNSRMMANIKKYIYNHSRIDYIFASNYMLNMAKSSPLLSGKESHVIPFGVDLSVFRPINKQSAKRGLGLPPESLVISFRAKSDSYKGLDTIVKGLKIIKEIQYPVPIILLAFDEKGLLEELSDKFKIVELGQVLDDERMAAAYNASDLFLMPSNVEAFGMMAIEAMACGVPSIVSNGNALEQVANVPYSAISISAGDTEGLAESINKLLSDERLRITMSMSARRYAQEHYDFNAHAENIYNVYESAIRQRRK